MKNRGRFLKSLAQFTRHPEAFGHWIRSCFKRKPHRPGADETTATPRPIEGVRSNLIKFKRLAAWVSPQIRSRLAANPGRLAPSPTAQQITHQDSSWSAGGATPRSAFTAVTSDRGAMVVRVFKGVSGVWPQQEYGCFDTWTQAQSFARTLNQQNGIDPVEARHIVMSAILARSRRQ